MQLVNTISALFVLLLCGRKVSSNIYDRDIEDYYQEEEIGRPFMFEDVYEDDNAEFTEIKESKRIVGGFETDISEIPYQVSISYQRKHVCGGSIINRKFILTASHCLKLAGVRHYSVRVGSSYLNRGGVVHKVQGKFIHPQLDEDIMVNDIGLLALETPLRYTKDVRPAKLPKWGTPEPRDGSFGRVSGWGTLSDHVPDLSNRLRAVDVPIISRNTCQRMYKNFTITDEMICAGYAYGGKDACHGDSGGPFVVKGIQIGIVSWGDGCAEPNSPGVYTSVSAMMKFINFFTSYYNTDNTEMCLSEYNSKF